MILVHFYFNPPPPPRTFGPRSTQLDLARLRPPWGRAAAPGSPVVARWNAAVPCHALPRGAHLL